MCAFSSALLPHHNSSPYFTFLQPRYALLNAIANQLRFPNAHTLFCSRLLLGTFLDGAGASSAAVAEVVREQLTRVLLERLIVHRPHPWGLLVTFIELIKAPMYGFWSHAFTRLNPDIEHLFEVRSACSVMFCVSIFGFSGKCQVYI